MNKKALIVSVAGQDGSYLAELLLEAGYDVHGIVRRNSTPEHQESRLDHISSKVKTHYGDLSDAHSLETVVRECQPDEIYNLGAQSHVRIRFEVP
jgi:GDPmannose 4,6-dehydratase